MVSGQSSSSTPTLKASRIDQLLNRKDVWRGHSQRFKAAQGLDTGFDVLNMALVNKGWPSEGMIELVQASVQSTWLLFSQAASRLALNSGGLLVLLDPPLQPNALALAQMKLPLGQIILLRTQTKSEFINVFVELARSSACVAVLAWQASYPLSYSELRKCHLACHEQPGLHVLHRHCQALVDSSPAILRLSVGLGENQLKLKLVKQRGKLQQSELGLALPNYWYKVPEYKYLYHLDSGFQPRAYEAAERSVVGASSTPRIISFVRGKRDFGRARS